MSTFNISVAIGGGSTFVKTAVATSTVFTTSANQYAKLKLRMVAQGLTGGSSGHYRLELGGVEVDRLTWAGTGNVYPKGAPDGGFREYLVPPSTSVVLVGSNSGTYSLDVAGSYVLLQNTV